MKRFVFLIRNTIRLHILCSSGESVLSKALRLFFFSFFFFALTFYKLSIICLTFFLLSSWISCAIWCWLFFGIGSFERYWCYKWMIISSAFEFHSSEMFKKLNWNGNWLPTQCLLRKWLCRWYRFINRGTIHIIYFHAVFRTYSIQCENSPFSKYVLHIPNKLYEKKTFQN